MIGSLTCRLCKNFLSPDKHPKDWRCKAFPNGIPEMTIANMKPFERPKNCNNGIGFEPIEDEIGDKK